MALLVVDEGGEGGGDGGYALPAFVAVNGEDRHERVLSIRVHPFLGVQGLAARQLTEVLENFEGRHRNLLEIFEARATEMEDALAPHAQLNKTQRCLVGAYFLHEYSFEAAALFNPSIVLAPDQAGLSARSYGGD